MCEPRCGEETIQRLERSVGALTTAANGHLETTLPWYRALPAQERSWVSLVAHTGLTSFLRWCKGIDESARLRSVVFGAAPTELTRSISLSQTLDLIRGVLEVVESKVDDIAAPGEEAAFSETVLRYSREVAFAAAHVYAHAYERRGAWDARLESLVVDALLRGLYRFRAAEAGSHKASILASGVAMYAAVEAQKMLADKWDVAADLWSATSWTELARDGFECERHELRHPDQQPRIPFVTAALASAEGPKVAVSDFQKAVPDQIRAWVPGDFTVLGCDGFGFSDTRPAARRFFNTDAESIVVAVLAGLAREGTIDKTTLLEAARLYRIDDVMAAPEPTTDPGVA